MINPKRIIFIFMLSVVSLVTMAETFFVSNGIRYGITDRFYGNSQYISYDFKEKSAYVAPLESGSYSGSINIPETVIYEGKTYIVKGIGYYAFKNSSLTSITLPETIECIDYNALSSVNVPITLPSSLKYIREFQPKASFLHHKNYVFAP